MMSTSTFSTPVYLPATTTHRAIRLVPEARVCLRLPRRKGRRGEPARTPRISSTDPAPAAEPAVRR